MELRGGIGPRPGTVRHRGQGSPKAYRQRERLVTLLGFEKRGALRKRRCAEAGVAAALGGTAFPAAGSVEGPLGETGRLGLATERATGEEGGAGDRLRSAPHRALPAVEANPRAGGTARPNAGARPAGGGPPMAGHVCRSI